MIPTSPAAPRATRREGRAQPQERKAAVAGQSRSRGLSRVLGIPLDPFEQCRPRNPNSREHAVFHPPESESPGAAEYLSCFTAPPEQLFNLSSWIHLFCSPMLL